MFSIGLQEIETQRLKTFRTGVTKFVGYRCKGYCNLVGHIWV